MGRLGSENSRPNGGCQEHAPILTVICDREAGKGLKRKGPVLIERLENMIDLRTQESVGSGGEQKLVCSGRRTEERYRVDGPTDDTVTGFQGWKPRNRHTN